MTLDGRVAIVTGGARNLGREYALGLASEGASVLVADIRDPASVVSEIAGQGGRASAFMGDLSDEETVIEMVGAAVDSFGSVDVLVNNAALYGDLEGGGPLETLDVSSWDKTMAVNVRGPFLCTKAVFPVMRQGGGGSIINISSGVVWLGTPMMAHYVTSKAAIIGLTRVAATEGGRHNIRVNTITPGFTMTQASKDMLKAAGADESAFDPVVAMTPLARAAEPADLVGSVVFLASSESAFITGQNLNVDGGWYKL